MLSWSQQGPTNTPVTILTYTAGCKDSQFSMLKTTKFVPSCNDDYDFSIEDVDTHANPRVDFLDDFEPFHPSMTKYGHSMAVCGEEVTSFRELIHQVSLYYAIQDPSLAADDYYVFNINGHQIGTGSGSVSFMGIEKYAQFFTFWRGGIRVRLLQITNTSTATQACYLYKDGHMLNAFCATSLNVPFLEFECPYYEKYVYKSVRTNLNTGVATQSGFQFAPTNSTPGYYFLCKSFDDNTTLFEPVLPYQTGLFADIPPFDGVYGPAGYNNYLTGILLTSSASPLVTDDEDSDAVFIKKSNASHKVTRRLLNSSSSSAITSGRKPDLDFKI